MGTMSLNLNLNTLDSRANDAAGQAGNQVTAQATILEGQELERFNELMEASYKKVYNMAFRLSGSRSDAEDLTQEAFVRAYRNFSHYEGDRPFENWIFRIVTRLFLDLLRNRRRRVRTVSFDAPVSMESRNESIAIDLPDHRPTPEARLMEHTFEEDIATVLDTLTTEQRMLIELADIEGVPYQEIATILDKPVGTVRSRLHRTHKLIRRRLEEMREAKRAKARKVGFA